MDVLLYDLSTSLGHHTVYFNRVLSILVREKHHVEVVFKDPNKIAIKNHPGVTILNPDEFQGTFFNIFLKFAYIFWGKQASTLYHIMIIRSIIKRQKLDNPVVFSPYLDAVFPVIYNRLIRSLINFRLAGLYVLPVLNSAGYFTDEKMRKKKEKFMKEVCSCLFLNDFYTQAYSRLLNRSNFFTLPELVDLNCSNQLKNQIREDAKGRYIIGIIGSLVKKKNFLRFLEVAASLEDEYYFLVVGKLRVENYDPGELDKINNLLSKIKDRSWQDTHSYIPTEEEYNELISVCDLVWLHHPHHPFSSNSLIKAMAFKKPVIVAPGHLMEETVRKYDWSIVVDDDADLISQAIMELKAGFTVPEEHYQQLLEDHSEEKFKNQILKAISACE